MSGKLRCYRTIRIVSKIVTVWCFGMKHKRAWSDGACVLDVVH